MVPAHVGEATFSRSADSHDSGLEAPSQTVTIRRCPPRQLTQRGPEPEASRKGPLKKFQRAEVSGRVSFCCHAELAPGTGGWRDADICPLRLPHQLPKAARQAGPACLPGPGCLSGPHTDTDPDRGQRSLWNGQLIVSRPGRPEGLGLSGLDRGP